MGRITDDKFAELLEAVPDAMLCVDTGGRIVLANVLAERLFGYGHQELAGQPVETLVPDAERAAHRRHRAGYAADPRTRPMGTGTELAGRRLDGSTFDAEITLSAIGTDDGTVVIAAVRDVTERMKAQAERDRLKTKAERDQLESHVYQAQRLESLGQLAGGVAHDFNNLLAVISSYASFIREAVSSEPSQVQWQSVREDIEQVERAAQRAAVLTHQLLAFARDKVVLPRVLHLNNLIRDLRELLARTLGEQVELITNLADDLGRVLADRGQIEQVLVNLAVNARDAMPTGGQLIIETANAEVDDAATAGRMGPGSGRFVRVRVSDCGVGMPKEIIDRAFDPFFTTKPEGEGTGLGLATVYGIVRQAGGHTKIYSEPGVGTTVTLLLPVTDRAAEPPPPRAPEPSRGAGEVVLVVEDEATMREVTRRILASNGYRVLAAADGREAIDIATSHQGHIDVLLTDVVMPQMLGNEVADRLRALQPGIRVLFMSGYTRGVLGNKGVLAAGGNLIEKPFAQSALLSKLSEILAVPCLPDGCERQRPWLCLITHQ
ncbi:MAG TPA: PAS domain S-box protein [Streptosporangiaceae bacterium]|nr:PAS domain S-box protein [Streptosporangiaceae bacterium]